MTRRIAGLAEIAGRFDALLVDQFGVLHDGRTAFPGARDCLGRIAAMGVPIVTLSNSGRRVAPNVARLAGLGFPPALFRGHVTSGELTHREIARRLADGRLAEGAAVAVIARDADTSVLDGLPVRPVPPDAPDADLLLIAGAQPEETGLDAYEAILAAHAARGVPALCANPDLRIYTADGTAFGPGVLAARYRALGRDVLTFGKPAAATFEAGLAALGNPDPAHVLMIGDSPTHDIAGAAAVGCRTLLVETGPQAGLGEGDTPADYAMADLVWRASP